MKILTSAEMREIDRTAIEELGIPGIVLMENAGLRIVRALKARFPSIAGERIVVVAGKGNNGGDGFVVARHLFNAGAKPEVLLLAARDEVKGDAAVNLAIALKMGLAVTEVRDAAAWKKARIAVSRASIVVDALFGTGLERPLEGLFASAVEDINRSAAFKVAVDIPSGLSADRFEIIGPSVEADLTVALAAPKIAHIFPPAAERVGELVVAPIGIPPALFENPALKLELVEESTVRPYFARRKRDTHKGSYGHLLIFAGSLGKSGASVLAGRAALRMGAGLVTVATAAGRPAVDRPGNGRAHDRAARRNAGPDDRRGRAAAGGRPAQGQERRARRARALDQRLDGRIRPRTAAEDQGPVRHRRRRAQHPGLASRGPGTASRPRPSSRRTRENSPGSRDGRPKRS